MLIFKILHAKLRVFRPQICALSAPNVRARRKRSALAHSKGFRRRAMHSCAFRDALAGAVRVLRAKLAPKLAEHLAIQPKITGSECNISRQKASLSSRKPAHLVQRTSDDHRCLSCASCARQRPQSRRFLKYCMQNRAFFDRKCALSVPNVRARRKRSALTHSKGFQRRAMQSCALRQTQRWRIMWWSQGQSWECTAQAKRA